jgi:hypothetical protein
MIVSWLGNQKLYFQNKISNMKVGFAVIVRQGLRFSVLLNKEGGLETLWSQSMVRKEISCFLELESGDSWEGHNMTLR